jgi:uncharacterized protein (DUF305 family)
MSNQPTPETDAAAWVETNQANALVLASFARNLERQRDELQRAVQNHQGAVNIAIEALDRTITQRDEARELARELRDALVAHYEEYSEWSIRGDVHNRVVAALTKAKEVLP